MKILLLMPCDEQHTYAATGIYKALPKEIKDITFAIPCFMEYLIDSKVVGNWLMALFDSMLSCRKLCDAATQTNDDLIIIGNAPMDVKFDAIFNFQEIDEALPYKDRFMEMAGKLTAEDDRLSSMVLDVHTAEESIMPLYNCVATADFLTHYLKSDDSIKELQKKYRKQLDELKKVEKKYGNDNKSK